MSLKPAPRATDPETIRAEILGKLTYAIGKNPAAVIIDLSDVDFLASAGMGVLVAARDKADGTVGFAVVASGPATSRPLKLVGLADVVGLYSTLDEARAAVEA